MGKQLSVSLGWFDPDDPDPHRTKPKSTNYRLGWKFWIIGPMIILPISAVVILVRLFL